MLTFFKRKISNAWLLLALVISLILTGISTPASGAVALKVLETTTTVSSVQTSGEIWRGLIPTSVVLMQGEYSGELEFPIEGRLEHKVLADRSLGVDVEFELWSSAGKKIASDTVRSYDWNPIGPNTLVSMTFYQRDLSASATYTLLIRTVYKVSTTGLLSRYLEDKKTLNFKIVEAKLPSKVTQTNNVAEEFEIGNALDATSYEIGIGFTNSNVTNTDCTKVPLSSYLPPVVIKTVTSLKFKLTDEDLYEIAKRLGASLNSPYRTVVRGVNQFGVGDWSSGFCASKFVTPAPAPAPAPSSTPLSKGNISETYSKICRENNDTLINLSNDIMTLNILVENFNIKYVSKYDRALAYFGYNLDSLKQECVIFESDSYAISQTEYNSQYLLNYRDEYLELNVAYRKALNALKTITCVKGKITKKVKNLNPKCPAGFKKK
jgi:hypothetical protein